MSHLTCPVCRLTITESAAGSALQPCPRCLLRDRTHRTMEVLRSRSDRFTRTALTPAAAPRTGRTPRT